MRTTLVIGARLPGNGAKGWLQGLPGTAHTSVVVVHRCDGKLDVNMAQCRTGQGDLLYSSHRIIERNAK